MILINGGIFIIAIIQNLILLPSCPITFKNFIYMMFLFKTCLGHCPCCTYNTSCRVELNFLCQQTASVISNILISCTTPILVSRQVLQKHKPQKRPFSNIEVHNWEILLFCWLLSPDRDFMWDSLTYNFIFKLEIFLSSPFDL